MSSRVDVLPCVGLDGDGHRHRRGCLPIVARGLPSAPAGWAWEFGELAPAVWSVWLRRVGGSGRWFVVGLDPAPSVSGLVGVIHGLAVGGEMVRA